MPLTSYKQLSRLQSRSFFKTFTPANMITPRYFQVVCPPNRGKMSKRTNSPHDCYANQYTDLPPKLLSHSSSDTLSPSPPPNSVSVDEARPASRDSAAQSNLKQNPLSLASRTPKENATLTGAPVAIAAPIWSTRYWTEQVVRWKLASNDGFKFRVSQ